MKIFFKIVLFLLLFVGASEANTDIFTQEEKQWMQEHHEIFYGADPSWAPFDYIDEDGRHQGLSQDYLNEVSTVSGLKFTLYAKKPWSVVMEDIKDKRIDLIPAIYDAVDRRKYLHYSRSYLKLAEYIFTQKDVPKIKDYKEVEAKSIAVVKGYAAVGWLQKNHPSIKVVLKKNLFECVQALSSGEVFGFIGDIPSSTYLQEKYFIRNIKANRIILDRDPIDVFMAVRYDYPLLASIISKSLKQINKKTKRKIFEKYSKSPEVKSLRGAFGFGRPPYMYDRTSAKGIEEALVRKAFLLEGIEVSEVRQMPMKRGQKVLLDNPEIDFSVAVLEDKEDGLFYSKQFVKYENIAITRRADKIKINTIKDLQKYKTIAWHEAYNMLGKEFNQLFNPLDSPKSYQEIFDQRLQHKKFFKKEADVILVDKNIFHWYMNQYKNKYEANQEYDFHKIFSQVTWVKVSFRDEALRDTFDLGLEKLRKNGEYDKLVTDFLKIDLQKQLDLSKLIASLSAEYIYEADLKGLEKILNVFDKVDIIKGIEVFSKIDQKSLLKFEKFKDTYRKVNTFSWGNSELSMIEKLSYFQDDGNTQHVGKVKVFFSVKDMQDIDISYIPNLSKFESFEKEEYKHIASIYKGLGLNSEVIQFSVDEQKWIQSHPKVSFVGDPAWLPYEAFDENGDYIGIVAEYLREIENVTGLEFEKVQTKSWAESVSLMKNKKIDMISETTDSTMGDYLHFTQPYLQNHIVIVMGSKAKYVDKLSQIQDKKIVVIKDYGYVHKIKNAYKDIKFIEVENISEGLKFVSSGRADALLCTMALGSYNISKYGFINLRIVGKTEFYTSIGYGVQPELAPLVSILNKSMLILGEGRKQEIIKKWILQKYVEKIDYTLVWEILSAGLILFGLFFYWNRQMKKEISLRIEAEDKLQETNDMVKDSIQFSSMIQQALIPTSQLFKSLCPSSFTIWKPRDIVGGDIYFIEKLRDDKELIIMMIDCTGHGVPGAFVTMLVKAIERNVVGYIHSSDENVSPAKILSIFNSSVKHLLKQENKNALSNAGFDAAIVYIDGNSNSLIYAGAEIPLYYLDTDDKIVIVKGNRHSIGYRTSKLDYVFKDHAFELDTIKRFYLSTDGYIDQNGGHKGFSFGKKRLMKLLEEGNNLDMQAQSKQLLDELKVYQGEFERNDDIAIIGIEVESLFKGNETLLQYEGLITQDKLGKVLDEVELLLKDKEYNEKILPKILAIVTEQMQNIMSYTANNTIESGNKYKSEGRFVLGFDLSKQKYFLLARNRILENDVTPIRSKLEKINSLNKQELRSYYKELRKSGSTKHERGAGLGFLEMAKNSSETLEYTIQEEQDKEHSFEIKVYI